MKVALLADIHGNAAALEAVLAAARQSAVEQVLIAGDLVGYYYDIERVLSLLQPWQWQAVRGNHEQMLDLWLAGIDRAVVGAKYGSGVSEAAKCLSQQQLQRLVSLPATVDLELAGKQLLLCHGAPWGTDCYVYPDAAPEIIQAFFSMDRDLVVFGHTHYPVLWQHGRRMVVNPGSVGQPRDRIPGACWALWDSDTSQVVLKREQYDARPLIEKARRIDPQITYLADVLTRK